MAVYLDIIPAVPIPRPGPQVFTWRAPYALPRGVIVRVSFRNRTVLGMVVGVRKDRNAFRGRIKDITEVISQGPLLPPATEKLLWWLSQSSVTPPSLVLGRFLPPWLRAIHSVPKRRGPEHVFSEKRVFGSSFLLRQDAVANILKKVTAGQSLLLVPDVATGQEWFLSLKKQGVPNLVWWSGATPAARRALWADIRSGSPHVVIGSPEALFLPFASLRALVVSNESNGLYRLERKAPYFDGKEGALVLARAAGAVLIYEGAFPSLELLARYPGIALPEIKKSVIIPMPRLRRGEFLTKELRDELKKIKDASGKALLFVSRKGTAPFIICRSCGKAVACPNCDAPIPLFVKQSRILRCRHCGHEMPPPMACPSCKSWQLSPRGVGSQAIAQALREEFSSVWVGRMDGEVTPHPKEQRLVLNDFRKTKQGILVATQMVLGKSLPRVNVVGVAALDQMLAIPDFQAEERLFTTLMRLQEFLKPSGKLIVQTWKPDNLAIQAAANGDYATFAKNELTLRREFRWPPFCRLAKLTFRHTSQEDAELESQSLVQKLRTIPKGEILGPNPAFIGKVRGKYVFHIILKWKPKNLQDLRIEKLLWTAVPRNWEIVVNPNSIL